MAHLEQHIAASERVCRQSCRWASTSHKRLAGNALKGRLGGEWDDPLDAPFYIDGLHVHSNCSCIPAAISLLIWMMWSCAFSTL